VVLITGAGGGLGRSHAIEVARRGADLVLFDLGDGHRDAEPGYTLANQSGLNETARSVRELGRRCLICTGDVRRQTDLDRAVERAIRDYGRIDSLVVNAGIIVTSPVWETTREEWDLLMGTNLTGAWQTMKAVVPHMISNNHGRIVVVASEAGLKGFANIGAYAASKAGLIVLSKSLAIELGSHLVTVNVVCPGSIPTGMNHGVAMRLGRDWDQLMTEFRQDQVLPVALEPSDVSHAVAFLLSDDARYVTGAVICVDAGGSVL